MEEGRKKQCDHTLGNSTTGQCVKDRLWLRHAQLDMQIYLESARETMTVSCTTGHMNLP